ncbi:hypothetical protein F4859DRAFT_525111 [Xylaria cf. heliscus]|nr:hypothetical protein F4859DRAFT_525111 [Xylaria cf. heliscus]
MDNQTLSSIATNITPINNQITTVNRLPENPTRGCFNNLPPELWLKVNDFFDSKSDLFRLSRVNKYLYSLLTFARAKCEAEVDRQYLMKNLPSMLYIALRQGRELDEISRIVAGYTMGCTDIRGSLLETHQGHSYEPPLHLAVRMDRIDVVELLLKSGVRINLTWGGHVVNLCPDWAHIHGHGRGSIYCKNALDIARECRNELIELFLLEKGIIDLDLDEPIQDWMQLYLNDAYRACKDWWPSF